VTHKTIIYRIWLAVFFTSTAVAWTVPADFDSDSDVDLSDYGVFLSCYNGPGRPPAARCTRYADFDGDGDVDLSDYGTFLGCYNGPGNLPACPDPRTIVISAGEFQMGDTFDESERNELPVHAVHLDAFRIDRYEVTTQQYVNALNWAYAQGGQIAIIDDTVYKYETGTTYPYCDTFGSHLYSKVVWTGSGFTVVPGRENHPMVIVSWYGAAAYANWRSAMEGRTPCYNLDTWACNFGADGYRLPTEAEWEKAARGLVGGHRFPWSYVDTIHHARANYFSWWEDGAPVYSYDVSPYEGYHPTFDGGALPFTSPVDWFLSNDYSLHDMAGNVLEWCNDWYLSSYYSVSPYENPQGPPSGSGRVLRGGSWSNDAYYCRVAFRGGASPDSRLWNYGFRCAAGT
jgi:sulfatase modifying factor 1